jgi:acetoin utilization deacetylase AcuC-like enzyme
MAKTAYVYDDIYLRHDTGPLHPESARRLEAINNKLKTCDFYRDLIKLSPSRPDIKHLETVHSRDYIASVKKKIESGVPALDGGDTAVCPKSYDVALMAVGGCLKACDAIMKGDARNAFCAVRPPGHHAERGSAGGFCIFNNVAISAKYLQRNHNVERIAIVDWDVHHGNGTQNTFESDESVLYISTHQYPLYPGSGSAREQGRDFGRGYTMNFPMQAGSTDADYLSVFNKSIKPALDSFRPGMILISAGFDAHHADQLASMRLSTDAYREFTRIIMETAGECCQGRVMAILEGGYNLDALANSVAAVIETFVRG